MGESRSVFKQPVPENPIEQADKDEDKLRALMTGKVAPYELASDIVEVAQQPDESEVENIAEEYSSAIRQSQEQITEVDENGDLSQQPSESYKSVNLFSGKQHTTRSSPLQIHLKLTEKVIEVEDDQRNTLLNMTSGSKI